MCILFQHLEAELGRRTQLPPAEAGGFESFVSYGLKSFTHEGSTDSRSKRALPVSTRTRTIVGVRSTKGQSPRTPPVLRTPTLVRTDISGQSTVLRTSVGATQKHQHSEYRLALLNPNNLPKGFV